MGKNKLKRFAENKEFPHFFQVPYDQAKQGFKLKGRWQEDFFRNPNPIVLELGCGKGEYTVGLAREHPEMNFIGVDIKGARMWRGARTSYEEDLPNVAFLRTRIELIPWFFGPEEVKEIWITFPDPHPRKGRARKRLTHPHFLERYRQFLLPDHIIHLKTDNPGLYQYTLDVIRHNNYPLLSRTNDLYGSGFRGPASQIQTFYEQMWLEEGLNIHYLQFSIDLQRKPEVPPDNVRKEASGSHG